MNCLWRISVAAIATLVVHGGALAQTLKLYKNPECACCEYHAQYLAKNGFKVETRATHDLPLIKREHGVPEALAGCHTILVEGYVVEGHVPVGALRKLLAERPPIKGISLPGMPLGSPGMAGEKKAPLQIMTIAGADQRPTVFWTE